MELEFLHEDDVEIEVILKGENHTYSNLLKNYIQDVEGVTFAAYKIPHPLLDVTKPVLKVKTDGTITAREALKKANDILIAHLDELQKLL